MKKNFDYILFIGIALVNAIVLYAGYMLFPDFIVLGNSSLSPFLATLLTAMLLSSIMTQPEPILKALKLKFKNEIQLGLVYLVANIIGLWVLARLASFIGFGVSSFVVVVILGFVLNLIQYLVWKMLDGKKKKK